MSYIPFIIKSAARSRAYTNADSIVARVPREYRARLYRWYGVPEDDAEALILAIFARQDRAEGR